MEKINSETTLRAAIERLEFRQAEEGKVLKEHFLIAYESIKPVNLVLNTFREIMASRDLKDNIINTSVGLAAGYLSKLVFERGTRNPVKKLAGNALMFGIVDLVAKNPETVKSLGNRLLKMIRGKSNGRIQIS
ncbi:MAG: hypothetical protein NT040_15660 [Bacteroidetes bacterium]|nr:hypothetical protein [Bacteroidota bacterium]